MKLEAIKFLRDHWSDLEHFTRDDWHKLLQDLKIDIKSFKVISVKANEYIMYILFNALLLNLLRCNNETYTEIYKILDACMKRPDAEYEVKSSARMDFLMQLFLPFYRSWLETTTTKTVQATHEEMIRLISNELNARSNCRRIGQLASSLYDEITANVRREREARKAIKSKGTKKLTKPLTNLELMEQMSSFADSKYDDWWERGSKSSQEDEAEVQSVLMPIGLDMSKQKIPSKKVTIQTPAKQDKAHEAKPGFIRRVVDRFFSKKRKNDDKDEYLIALEEYLGYRGVFTPELFVEFEKDVKTVNEGHRRLILILIYCIYIVWHEEKKPGLADVLKLIKAAIEPKTRKWQAPESEEARYLDPWLLKVFQTFCAVPVDDRKQLRKDVLTDYIFIVLGTDDSDDEKLKGTLDVTKRELRTKLMEYKDPRNRLGRQQLAAVEEEEEEDEDDDESVAPSGATGYAPSYAESETSSAAGTSRTEALTYFEDVVEPTAVTTEEVFKGFELLKLFPTTSGFKLVRLSSPSKVNSTFQAAEHLYTLLFINSGYKLLSPSEKSVEMKKLLNMLLSVILSSKNAQQVRMAFIMSLHAMKFAILAYEEMTPTRNFEVYFELYTTKLEALAKSSSEALDLEKLLNDCDNQRNIHSMLVTYPCSYLLNMLVYQALFYKIYNKFVNCHFFDEFDAVLQSKTLQ